MGPSVSTFGQMLAYIAVYIHHLNSLKFISIVLQKLPKKLKQAIGPKIAEL